MAEEVKKEEAVEVSTETTPEVQPEEKKEPTISEALGKAEAPKKTEAKPETVGLDKYMKEKKERQAAEKALKELRERVEAGDSVTEVSDDLDDIAEEFNLDKSFTERFARALDARAEKKAEEKIAQRLKPLEEKERQERIDKAFNKGFDQALGNLPEYKDIVNPKVIKALSLDPENADKTFTELIEETYGNSLSGKRTIETTKPRGGKEPETIDFARAKKDPSYFKEIMADPASKKKYNEGLIDRLSSFM